MSPSADMNPDRSRFPKCAIVTGASGFIGRSVTRHLAENGCIVKGIGTSEISTAERDALSIAEWYSGGISSEVLSQASKNAEVIFHCAGSGSVPLSLREPMVDFEKNVAATATVLNFSRENGKLPVVFLSSAGVYGNVAKIPIPVTASCDPISPYGINKQIGEILVNQYARCFDVPCAIVRLFSVYGAGLRKQLLWDASHKLHQGDFTFFGTGEESRDWIHVEDAAELIVRLWRHASVGVPVYNGACGDKVTNRHILGQLAECYGLDHAIAFDGRGRPGDPKAYVADIATSLETGWHPRVALREGLQGYADWFRKNIIPELSRKTD